MTLQEAGQTLEQGSRELALAGAALLLAGLALTPICVTFARRFAPKGQVFFARWRFLHAALVAAVLALAMQFVPGLLGSIGGFGRLPEGLRALIGSASGLGLSGALILVLAARLDPDGITSLGLRPRDSLRAAAVAVGCYVLLLPGLFGLTLLWPWLLERIGGSFEPQKIALGIESLDGGARAAAALFAIAVLPFFEELVFRGFLQPLLVQNLGDRGGVFLASLIFATLHGDSAFLPIFGLALLLGSLKLRTQRLSAPFAVHALHNAIAFFMLGVSPGS